MDTLAVILLGFCFSFLAEGTNSNSRPKSAVKHPELTRSWQTQLEILREKYKKYKNPQPVGGVQLNAEVLYDFAFYYDSRKWHNRDQTEAGNDGNKIKEYFESLFRQLEDYFHKQSINVNITVKSVTENNETLLYYAEKQNILNANKTLEKLIKYGESQGKPANTVFYYFVWPPSTGNPYRTFDVITTGRKHRLGALEVSTQGTFCSTGVSAALVRHMFGSGTFWGTASATTTIFGSQHFLAITPEDREEMNKTLSRCLRGTAEESKDVPGPVMQC